MVLTVFKNLNKRKKEKIEKKIGKNIVVSLLASNLLKIFKIYFYNLNHKNSVLLCSLMKITIKNL